MKTSLFFAVAVAATGCATNPAPVSVIADAEGEHLLAGAWVGDYFTSDGGRVGNITFTFGPHDSTRCGITGAHAHGDVLMIAGYDRTSEGTPEARDGEPAEAARVLTIEFVKVTGTTLWGRLTPYTDPVTGESLYTTFNGAIEGSRIVGTLETIHGKSGIHEGGKWEVMRRAD